MNVDNLLTDAGRSWRAQNEPLVPRPDITGVVGATPARASRPRNSRRVAVAVLATVAAVATITGGLAIAMDRADRGDVLVASPDAPVTPTVPVPTTAAPATTTGATPTSPTTTDATSTGEGPSTPTSPGTDLAALVAASTLVDTATVAVPDFPGQVEFQSPSGRIACAISDGSRSGQADLECVIDEPTYPQPTRPADCEFDYGNMFGLPPGGPGELLCLSDTLFSGQVSRATVQYGQRVEHGGFVCVVAEDGVRCAGTDLEHGFRVSRSSYDLF